VGAEDRGEFTHLPTAEKFRKAPLDMASIIIRKGKSSAEQKLVNRPRKRDAKTNKEEKERNWKKQST